MNKDNIDREFWENALNNCNRNIKGTLNRITELVFALKKLYKSLHEFTGINIYEDVVTNLTILENAIECEKMLYK